MKFTQLLLKTIPSGSMESQSEDDGDDIFDINECSDDENIVDRILDDKKYI